MKWALTDDYAALTTSIMAAVQVIATVQFERRTSHTTRAPQPTYGAE
ncbi:hypothetical protein [Streptomyces sediminimaris]